MADGQMFLNLFLNVELKMKMNAGQIVPDQCTDCCRPPFLLKHDENTAKIHLSHKHFKQTNEELKFCEILGSAPC